MFDVRNARHAVGQGGKVRRAAGCLQFAAAVQLFGERYQVDGLLALAEGDHLHVNAAMLIEEEIFRTDIFNGGIQGVVVEQNGAKNRALCVEIARERAFECRVSGHGQR